MVVDLPKKPSASLFSADLFGYDEWMPDSAAAEKYHNRTSVKFGRLGPCLCKGTESFENELLRDIQISWCSAMCHQTVWNWAGLKGSLTYLHFATNVGRYRSGVKLLRGKVLEAKTKSRALDKPAQLLALKILEAK